MPDQARAISSELRDALQHVRDLLDVEDFRQAHTQLLAIVATSPDLPEAQRLLGGVQLALGDAVGAERTLRHALEVDPGWVPTWTILGELLIATNRHAEGEHLLLQASGGRAADPRAAQVLARWYNGAGRPARALSVVAPFCGDDDVVPELAIEHVAALVALGRAEDAVAHYRALTARTQSNFGAWQALTIALSAAGHHGEVKGAAQQAVQRGVQTAALSYARARSLVALSEFEPAESALRECIALEPYHADAHNELARLIWMRSGNVDETTAQIDIALRGRPDNDALWAAKSAVLLGAGDPRGAYECLAPRAERNNAQPALMVRTGFAALEFDAKAALAWADRALRALPGSSTAQVLRVAALLGVGDANGALSACRVLRMNSPNDQYLIALQTTAWRMLGDERYLQLCDYPNMVVSYRLEAPTPWTSLADFLRDVELSLTRLHDAMHYPLLFQSLRHGTETNGNLTNSRDPVLRALFGVFDAPIRDYIQRIGHGTSPLQRRNVGSYAFSGGWSVRLRSHGFHENHVHPAGWISSACYIKLPHCVTDQESREGALAFAEPGIITVPKLSAQHEVRPETGTLVLFPSYFWHGTVPFAGNDTRLTVAFDAVPDMGIDDPMALRG